MKLPMVGDRVSLEGRDFLVSGIDEEAGTMSLTSDDDVVQQVPIETLDSEDDSDE